MQFNATTIYYNRWIGLLLISLVIISGRQIHAQPAVDYDKHELLDQFITDQMEVDHIPGLSVGYVQDTSIWAKGYGYIDLENEVPADKYSTYRLASNTKSMTALAILQLYEQNKLNLEDPVQKYVPYYPEKRWEVSLRQILGHIGGIPHYQDYEKEGHIKETKDTRDAIDIFADFHLVAEPGSEFNYSSYGYNLLGAAIEETTHMHYEEYLKKNIWEPLKMHKTYLDRPGEIIKNRAEGYQLVFGELKNSEFVNITSRFASGGICASVVDLLKYARGLNHNRLLSENSIDLMETSMKLDNGKFTDYGMGWRIQPVNGRYMVYHTGGQPETRTMLVRFPEEQLAIAVAYNLEGGSLKAFPKRFYQLLFDEGWNIKPYIGNEFDQTLLNGMWDVYNYGLAAYKKNGFPSNFDEDDWHGFFSYLNQTLHPDSLQNDLQDRKSKIQWGRHPRAKQSYVCVGQYMAGKIAKLKGPEQLEKYHKEGAFTFFKDYIKLSKIHEEIPFQLNSALIRKLELWIQAWNDTWNDFTRHLWLGAYTDLQQQIRELQKLFAGKALYPDYTVQLANAIWEYAIIEGPENAVPMAKTFTALYPESAIPQLILAQCYVSEGDAQKAEHALDIALSSEVDRYAVSAINLNRYANRLYRHNYLDAALMMIDIAEKFYPDNAQLHESRGDIFMEKSRRQFQKALQIDPTINDTKQKLKRLE